MLCLPWTKSLCRSKFSALLSIQVYACNSKLNIYLEKLLKIHIFPEIKCNEWKNYNEVSPKNCRFSISSVLVILNLLLSLWGVGKIKVFLMEKCIVSGEVYWRIWENNLMKAQLFKIESTPFLIALGSLECNILDIKESYTRAYFEVLFWSNNWIKVLFKKLTETTQVNKVYSPSPVPFS